MNAQPPGDPGTPTSSSLSIRPIRREDRTPLARLIARDGLFTEAENRVALELIDAALADLDGPHAGGGEFRVRVADADGALAGYLCFGPTPMTDGTWDLYWIVSDPGFRRSGVGSRLIVALEDELRGLGARRIRIETSSTELYGAAHGFYQRLAYPVQACLPDFYRPGDDLVILYKSL